MRCSFDALPPVARLVLHILTYPPIAQPVNTHSTTADQPPTAEPASSPSIAPKHEDSIVANQPITQPRYMPHALVDARCLLTPACTLFHDAHDATAQCRSQLPKHRCQTEAAACAVNRNPVRPTRNSQRPRIWPTVPQQTTPPMAPPWCIKHACLLAATSHQANHAPNKPSTTPPQTAPPRAPCRSMRPPISTASSLLLAPPPTLLVSQAIAWGPVKVLRYVWRCSILGGGTDYSQIGCRQTGYGSLRLKDSDRVQVDYKFLQLVESEQE